VRLDKFVLTNRTGWSEDDLYYRHFPDRHAPDLACYFEVKAAVWDGFWKKCLMAEALGVLANRYLAEEWLGEPVFYAAVRQDPHYIWILTPEGIMAAAHNRILIPGHHQDRAAQIEILDRWEKRFGFHLHREDGGPGGSGDFYFAVPSTAAEVVRFDEEWVARVTTERGQA
jgi:hypothetical protein